MTQTVVRPERAGEASRAVFTVVASFSAVVVATLSTILALGTGGDVAASADLDDIIATLMVTIGGTSIVAGIVTLFAVRVTREEIAALQQS